LELFGEKNCLPQAQQNITLVWIPGHSGIPGKADLEAKQATTQDCGNEF
jgi:hypothetical protein